MAKKANSKKSVGQASKARAKKTSAASSSKKQALKKNVSKVKKPSKAKSAQPKTTKSTASANVSYAKIKVALQGLRGWHVLAGVVFAGLIALMYTLVDAIERNVVVGYSGTDALRDDVLAPAIQNIVTIDVRHIVVAALGAGVVYSVFVVTRGWSTYITRARKGSLMSRWIVAAVAGALGATAVALLLGVYDLVLIKLLALLLVGASFLAYRADIETGANRKSTQFIVGVVMATVAFLTLAVFVAFSMWYGATLPLYIYIAADVFALGLLAYAVNQLFSLKKRKGFTQSEVVERNYVVITMVTALLFVSTLVVGSVT